MKKIYVAAAFVGLAVSSQAQVLLQEGFQGDVSHILIGAPSGATPDLNWYNFDEDGLPDGSGGSRPDEWFLIYPFADADAIEASSGDSNIVISANSWFSTPNVSKNWLITASVDIPAGATNVVLKWKSAPRQTPLYLDGYKVLISTATNDIVDFTTTLFTGSEYTAGSSSNLDNFALYTFAPTIAAGGWVHGWDGTSNQPAELEAEPGGDLSRNIGVLTEHSVSLTGYAGQTVFAAFLHESDDDNLISIDDIIIENITSVNEVNAITKITSYPNPTVDYVTVEFSVENATPVIVTVTDVLGNIVSTQSLGFITAGNNKHTIDASGLANGTYNVQIRSDKGAAVTTFIKK